MSPGAQQTGPSVADEITVVTGLPRSGTSMAMGMLHAAGVPLLVDAHRPADASNPRGYFEYAPVKATRREAAWVASARGRAVKVIHALVPHLPEAERYRVVWMQRDLDEVLRSQERMLERQGQQPEVGDRALLRTAYARQLDELRVWLGRRSTASVLELDHALVLGRPDEAAHQLARFVGRPAQAGAMARAVDASLYRERSATPAGSS